MSDLKEGAPLPEFAAVRTSTGEELSSQDLAGKKAVLFFYPKADTPGCTKESCAFRDRSASFSELGVSLYGVSKDPVAAQEKFRDKYELTMPLLADTEGAVCEAFGVLREKTRGGKTSVGLCRDTVLVADGKVARVWRNVKVDGHADAVLAAAKEL